MPTSLRLRRIFGSLRSLAYLRVALVVSVLFAGIQTTDVYLIRQTNAAARPVTWSELFAITLPSWVIVALAFPLILKGARRFAFNANAWSVSALVHGLFSALFAATQLAFWSCAWTLSGLATTAFRDVYTKTLESLLFSSSLSYWAIVGTYLILRNSRLRAELAEARLDSLRAQLNPHFLFNALQAASTLVLTGDSDRAIDALASISELLRASLAESRPEIPLSREMELVDAYVGIQRIRFRGQVALSTNIGDDALTGLVPVMLLQPFVENSIKHGLAGDRRSLHVTIAAQRQSGQLLISVSDDGPGFLDHVIVEGVGLSNTRGRLAALYGERHEFVYNNSPEGGAIVTVRLPFHELTVALSSKRHP